MQNKNIIIAGIIILIGTGLAFYFLQDKEVNGVDEANEKNILTKEYFSIEIPDGWEETRGIPGISAMIANLDEENEDPEVIKMGFKSYFAVAYESATNRTMEEFVEYTKNELIESGTEIEIIAEKNIIINSREAYLIEGELEQEEANFKAFIVIVKGDGNDMWFITFNTALNGWERYQSLFDQVAQSFTLLKEMEELEDNREIGLQAIILEQGEGEEAKAGDILSVYYSGELEDGTQFDAREEGEPFTFTLGAGKVIAGWDQGLVGMKVGEKRKLVIPSELAYGEQGRPGAIPPNAVLIFRVELLKIGE